MTSRVPAQASTPRLARVATEDGFGARVRGWISASGARFVDVAASLGMRREDLYEVMDGAKHARAAWLELLPPAVEILYLRERAAHHALDLRPVADASSPHARMHAVVSELSDVVRCAATSEADGFVSVEEATDELREIEEAERALSARKAHLLTVVDARGKRVGAPS